MNERRHELAVLRALGARRRTVFAAVVGEASLIALAGALLGFLVYLGVLARIRGMVLESTGVLLEYGSLGAAHVWTPIGMLAVGALAGVLPAWKAYSTDVCRTLSAAG
jgi:putative ABC transport system permease protein